MRWTTWSSLAAVGLLAAGMLAAVPKGLAEEIGVRGGPQPQDESSPPAAPLAPAGVGGAVEGADPAAGSIPVRESPFLGTENARSRLKQFVTQVYKRQVGGAPANDQPPLEEVLAQIDALSAEQVNDVDARLSPVIWATRGLATLGSPRGDGDAEHVQATDPETLRQELDAYFARLAPYAPMAGSNSAVYASAVTQMRETVVSMSDEDLQTLADLFASMPSAEAVLRLDPATILGSPPPGGSAVDGSGGAAPAIPLAGSFHTNSPCADMAFGPVATVVLKAVASTAEDIAELLSDDYMATSFNIPNPVKIVAKTIALPLELLAIAAEADLNYFSNCNDNAHMQLFTEHDEETNNRMGAIASLLDDESKQSDLKRILDNRMDRIDVFNAEFRDLTLRLAIEKDLLRQGYPRIALFQVPSSVCVTVGEHSSCGQLETVRDIVADTIFMNRAAGFDTTLASTALADGDQQKALGLYKAAYTRYRYSYQLAVRSGQ